MTSTAITSAGAATSEGGQELQSRTDVSPEELMREAGPSCG